tara:strand:+ start:2534 stop:4369 length:1836 start_codon:yes stop_codon:yes gene_type:complete
MVSSLLRPLFQRTARGFNTPQGRMFTLGTGPLMVDSLTDTGNITPADFQDDVTTDISTEINVTSKDPQPNAPVDGPPIKSQVESKKEEIENEQSLTTNSGAGTETNNYASNDLQNDPVIADYIDNDSVKRINNYKDVIKNFIGDSSGNKLQKIALLMQIGSSLMSGRTDQPGLRGFFDVVGQTGQQTAPLLFEMGVEKAKADREIGAAALDLYFQEMEDMQDRSGPYVMVYQNYKTEDDGSISLDAKGNPIKLEKPLKVLTVKRTSPEETKFYGFNQAYGFDVFSFVEAGEGQDAFGLNYADSINVKGDASSDAQVQYANYVKRGLVPLANEIIPLIIERPDLIGASGELGKIVGPAAQVFEEFTGQIIAGDFDSADPTGSGFAVRETANGTMTIGGVEIPVFVDRDNKYGGNGLTQDRYGAALGGDDYGVDTNGQPARAYVVADTFTKLLQSGGERSVLETFETTLGLMLARDRQPTGRMLADVLRRSFEDVRLTGIGGRTTDKAIIQNYVRIYNQLYNNMSGALTLAGYDKEKQPDFFTIEGSKKLENAYYNWLSNNPEERALNLDISGGMGYPDWMKSFEGNIQVDHNENMQKNEQTYESLLDKYGLN